MREFLSMGGYAWYVWMSFGGVALVLLAESLGARMRLRNAQRAARSAAAPAAAPVPRFDPARGT